MTKQMGRPPKPKGSTHPHKRMCRFSDAQVRFLEFLADDLAKDGKKPELSKAIRFCVDNQRGKWINDDGEI